MDIQLKRRVLIGIDGLGGAGKSTFANRLKKQIDSIQIVHVDDFFKLSTDRLTCLSKEKPIGADFDLDRLEQSVLIPFVNHQDISFQKYHWEKDILEEWVYIDSNQSLIVEGIYSLNQRFLSYYDWKIWIDAPRDIRLNRGLKRDGMEAIDRWVNDWMVCEDQYERTEMPKNNVDMIIRGTE